MAFSDFTSIERVQAAYGIRYSEAAFIEYMDLPPSEYFRRELAFSETYVDILTSEAARCENLIYPILREVYKYFAEIYALWSHKALTYDVTLTGVPDYLFTTRSPLGKTVLGTPVVVVVEAKQNNFLEGWGQCLAELVAAQKLNHDDASPVYGIVTDGEFWQFGRLLGTDFTRHTVSLTRFDLDTLFGAIGFLLSSRAPVA